MSAAPRATRRGQYSLFARAIREALEEEIRDEAAAAVRPNTWIWPSMIGWVLEAEKPPWSFISLAAVDAAAIIEGSSVAMGIM